MNDSGPSRPSGSGEFTVRSEGAAAEAALGRESGAAGLPAPLSGAEPGSVLWKSAVNGRSVRLEVPPAKRLLDIVRDDLGLTGTKRSCEIGRCGACMVLVDGAPVNAGLMMAYQCAGRDIVTIEGIAEENGGLHPVQRAFLEEGGYQCGYCTPGMIVSVKALLDAVPDPSPEELEEALSGNLCRCTGYGGIVRSVRRAIEERRGTR